MRVTSWWLIPGWLALGTILGIGITMFHGRGGAIPPPFPKIGPLVILVLVMALLWWGWQIRRMKARKTTYIDAPMASRVAVFAVASAHSGALLTGVFGVMSALYWMDFASHYMLVQTIVLGLMALTSFALSAVGIVVERWCRISGDDDSSATGASAAA